MIWKNPVALLSPLNRNKSNTDYRLNFYYSMKCRGFSPLCRKMKLKRRTGGCFKHQPVRYALIAARRLPGLFVQHLYLLRVLRYFGMNRQKLE